MAQEPENDDDMEEVEYVDSRRDVPRFGPFVTIAVAILMLFGAASRIGKDNENINWLDSDSIARHNLDEESRRKQEAVATTLITLGTAPMPNTGAAQTNRAPIINRTVPPSRIDSPSNQGRRIDPGTANRGLRPPPVNDADRHSFDPAPEAGTRTRPDKVYVVQTGDNWVEIGKRTGKRWQDIQRANPQSKNGLRVGMRLTIP